MKSKSKPPKSVRLALLLKRVEQINLEYKSYRYDRIARILGCSLNDVPELISLLHDELKTLKPNV